MTSWKPNDRSLQSFKKRETKRKLEGIVGSQEADVHELENIIPSQEGDEHISHTDTEHEAKWKKEDNPTSCSIFDICTGNASNVFEGDVLVLYGPASLKTSNSLPKAQIVHADLVDMHGQLSITVNISDKLISDFVSHFPPGNSVRITRFDITKRGRGKHERGDAACCITLKSSSVVEKIPLVCAERKPTPDTTIRGLLESDDDYVVGSFATIVTGCRQNNHQYEMFAKDGETSCDTETVHFNNHHKETYLQIQQLLSTRKIAMLLFKNVVRTGPKGSHNIRTTMSTFVEQLNGAPTKAYLQTLAKQTVEVTGLLRPTDVFMMSFKPLCKECKQIIRTMDSIIEEMLYCTKRAHKTPYFYGHTLQCTMHKKDDKINYLLPMSLLEQFFPRLVEITFDQYKQDISQAVFLR